MLLEPQQQQQPPFATLSHTIITRLAVYDAKCKETGINPWIDFARFMSIAQAVITIKKQKNGRIS